MPSKRLYLRDLPEFVSEDELSNHLSSYGKINEVKILQNYGFVEFELAKDAQDVLDTFREQPFLGKKIVIEFAHPMRKDLPPAERKETRISRYRPARRAERPPPSRFPVIVDGIPRHICWQELKDFGRLSGGRVAYCDLDRRCRSRGFVEYSTLEDADRAIAKLDGKELGGQPVRVYSADSAPAEVRRRSRSRSPVRYRYPHNESADSLVSLSTTGPRTPSSRYSPPDPPAYRSHEADSLAMAGVPQASFPRYSPPASNAYRSHESPPPSGRYQTSYARYSPPPSPSRCRPRDQYPEYQPPREAHPRPIDPYSDDWAYAGRARASFPSDSHAYPSSYNYDHDPYNQDRYPRRLYEDDRYH